jgi:hypothetical protein
VGGQVHARLLLSAYARGGPRGRVQGRARCGRARSSGTFLQLRAQRGAQLWAHPPILYTFITETLASADGVADVCASLIRVVEEALPSDGEVAFTCSCGRAAPAALEGASSHVRPLRLQRGFST